MVNIGVKTVPNIMDKFVIVGGFLCFAADVFAIASLATPEWVVTDFAGKLSCN